LCRIIAPVDGATSGTLNSSSSGRIASVCGVPRFMNSATTFFSVISLRAFSAASLGSNLSSIEISSTRWPWMPPVSLTWSIQSLAPSVFSFTPEATGPVKPEVWPMWSCAQAAGAAAAASSPAASAREAYAIQFMCPSGGRA
jgi:hypothetical protein